MPGQAWPGRSYMKAWAHPWAAIAAAFLTSPPAGFAATIAVIAHEVPQEVSDYALLRHWGYPRAKALAALVAVQLTAFCGAIGVIAAAAWMNRLAALVLAIAS